MTREVVLTPASEIPPYRPDWSPWFLRADNLTLEVWPERNCMYYVDLEECLTQMVQRAVKRWPHVVIVDEAER